MSRRTYSYVYGVQLAFEPHAHDPSRIFRSMGKAIDAFKKLDVMLGRAIHSSAHVTQALEALETGSIFTRLQSVLEFDESDDLEEEPPDESAAEAYVEDGRVELLDSMRDNPEITDVRQLDAIRQRLYGVAERCGLAGRFSYSAPQDNELSETIESIEAANESLEPHERFTYTSQQREVEVPRGTRLSTDEIAESRVEQTIENDVTLILKIKRPDFLGTSRWDMKHGTKTIQVRIEDDEWLADFHAKNAPVTPGDSLNSQVLVREQYDRFGELVKEDYVITKVNAVIAGQLE